MSLYQELSYDRDFDVIKGIQFCVMSPDEIRKRSVVEITKSETYNGSVSVPNALFDDRMGVIEHNKVCPTCHLKNTFCVGHFGHIELAKPVFYVQFFDIVKKLLKCVCFRCSKLLIDVNDAQIKSIMNKKYSRQKQWELVYKACCKQKPKRCGQFTTDGCGAKQPTINKEGMLKIGMEWKDLNLESGQEEIRKQVLLAEDVLQILKRISDRDAELLGFHTKYSRPEWLICTVLPVPPPAVRPSVRTDTGQRQEDDLTHKLLMVIKYNKALKDKLARHGDKLTYEQVDMLIMLLQYEMATLIDNTNPSIPVAEQKTGRPIKSITERLKSKEGRIRGNLMGKRVDFSARSVITPDPNIGIDELGVPLKIAMNMTFPERVTRVPDNKEELERLVANGPDKYPGAKHVRKIDENRIVSLRNNLDRKNFKLDYGDVVDRHLRNGDWVLFNRQPSLHRMSMQAFKVRVMPEMKHQTFRLNVQVTPSFNADEVLPIE
jgi:DNA-directed RNA polymerase II subunit RPB1